MRRLKFALFVTLLIICKTLHAQEKELISFKVEDQFSREYTEKSWQDSVLVVFGSDKDGAKYNEIWATALYEEYMNQSLKTPIAYIGIADLSSVPFFLKGTIKKFFQKGNDNGIIMDWEGVFPENYAFKEDMCNILLFDYNRNLIYKTAVTSLDNTKVLEIINRLRNIKS